MKRFFVAAALALMCALPVFGQILIDEDGAKKKVASSDDDIRNPRKAAKAETWMDRGDAYYGAATEVTKALYRGFERENVVKLFPKPRTSTKKIGDTSFTVLTYPYFALYFKSNKLTMWETTLILKPNALETATTAYVKAAEMDPKLTPQARLSLIKVSNAYRQEAQNYYGFQNYAEAADQFEKAYKVSALPIVNYTDTLSLFNAGFLYTIAEKWDKAEEMLNKSISINFSNNGDAYYYLYHIYNTKNEPVKARMILTEGVKKYPTNSKLVEGLVRIYVADPSLNKTEIADMVKEAIKADPNNSTLWSGLGLIYNSIDEPQKAIDAFEKAVALSPKNYGLNYNIGLMYTKKANDMIKEMSKGDYQTQEDFNKAKDLAFAEFQKSVPYLENALKIQPNDVPTLEILSSVTYRLRELPGMAEKNEKYKEQLEKIKAQAAAAAAQPTGNPE